MSTVLTSTDRKLLWITGGVALVLVALAAVLAPSGDTAAAPTTYSSASGGARASYLLLSRLGYRVSRWERPLNDIPTIGKATFVIADPERAATAQERDALAAFVDAGGRLILTGGSFSTYFLQTHQIASDVPTSTWPRLEAVTPSRLTRSAPEIAMASNAWWRPGGEALPLYAADSLARVVVISRGRGEIVWCAAATPFTNAGLREPGNLEFVLSAIGSERERPIVWDEYVHGHSEEATSPKQIAAGWLAVHGVLAAVAVLFTFSRRSGPVIEPLTESRLSPLEFAATLGALYERAGAASIAVDVALRRFVYRLTRRVGLPSTASTDVIVRATTDRWQLKDDDFAQLMQACDAASRDADLSPAQALTLTRRLAGYTEQWIPDRGRTPDRQSSSKERPA